MRRDLVRIDDRRLSMVDVRKSWGGRQPPAEPGDFAAVGLVELAYRCSEAADSAAAPIPSVIEVVDLTPGQLVSEATTHHRATSRSRAERFLKNVIDVVR